MPKYAYEMGDVTINVHLLGYREGSIKNVVLQVTTAFEGQRRINVNINTKTGKGVVRFRQYGTGCSRVIVDGKGHENFFFAPGEKINLYVNLSRINQSIRYNYKTPIKSPAIKGCWTKGSRYDALNNLPSFDWNGTLTAYDYVENVTDADAYTERLIDYYNDECDYIDNFSCHPWKKVIGKNNTLINCLNALKNDYRRYFESDENDTVGITSVPFESKYYERIYSLVNLDNPWLLLTIGANSIVENTQNLDHSEKRGMLFELSALLNAIPKAYRNQLTNEELQTMRQWSNPFYAAMCEDIINRKREAIATSRKDLTHVEDIAPEALFEAITAPHKGKVILVDFWNTWCRPCRNAIKAVEPYKTGELSSEDLVWVYIANETSPINIYSEMIPGIKGIHYRVNDAQWDYLTSKMFGVTGIPSYVLVDKEGNYSLRNDLRDHAKMVSTLKEELSK